MSHLLAFCLCLAATSACSEADPALARTDERGARPLHRLIDLTPEATFESAIKLDDTEQLLQSARVLFKGAPLVGTESVFSHKRRVVSSLLERVSLTVSNDLACRVVAIPAAARWALVRIDSDTPHEETNRCIGFSARAPLDDFDDDNALVARIRKASPTTIRAVDGDTNRYEAIVERAKPGEAIAVCITGTESFLDSCVVTILALEPQLAWLKRTPPIGDSPWLRRVEISNSAREAIVIPSPGSVTFRAQLPDKASIFSVAVGSPLEPSTPENVRVVIQQGDREETAECRLKTGGENSDWRRLEVDLSGYTAGDVQIRMSTQTAGRRNSPESEATTATTESSGNIVAFGNPTLRADTSDTRPDVIFVSLDTVRADHLSLYGADRKTSPRLDALAPSSMVFDKAIAPASWTLPSHASIMSGLYPDRHGAHTKSSTISADTRLLAEQLREAGYETIGVTGGGFVNPQFGFSRGFERYDTNDPAFPPPEYALAQDANPRFRRAAREALEVRQALLDQIEGPRSGPRFFFVHTYAAHNYTATSGTLQCLVDDGSAPPGASKGALAARHLAMATISNPDAPETKAAIEESRWLYDGSIWAADALVGDLVDSLEASGRLDNTLLIIASDHGEMLGERGLFGHTHHLFEELLRVPLVIRGPGVDAGRCDQVVSLVDLAPTILELANVNQDRQDPIDGRSLVPLLKGEGLPPRPALARAEHRSLVNHALRGSRLKLFRHPSSDGSNHHELFDLKTDPDELADLSMKRAKDTARLAKALDDLVTGLQLLGVTGDQAAMSSELLENLRQLGYLGD